MKTLLILLAGILPLSTLATEPKTVKWHGVEYPLAAFYVRTTDPDLIVLRAGAHHEVTEEIPWEQAPKAVQKNLAKLRAEFKSGK